MRRADQVDLVRVGLFDATVTRSRCERGTVLSTIRGSVHLYSFRDDRYSVELETSSRLHITGDIASGLLSARISDESFIRPAA
jgi:hypothetical protein